MIGILSSWDVSEEGHYGTKKTITKQVKRPGCLSGPTLGSQWGDFPSGQVRALDS